MHFKEDDIMVPLDVPKAVRENYINNYLTITKKSGRLMLFAGDQKVEHLNSDFYGEGIHPDDGDPEHLFRIASQANIGVFATQLGLVARYGSSYADVPYLVKLNSKTNLVKTSQSDPFSNQWLDVQQVIPWGTPAEVRAEVRHLMDTYWRAGEGRLILTAGNGINEDCPLENLEAFFDEAVSYGSGLVAAASTSPAA